VTELSRGVVFVTSSDEGTIQIYPLATWRAMVGKLVRKNKDDASLRQFLLRANFMDQKVAIDKHGRIRIPSFLRKRIGLEGVGYLSLTISCGEAKKECHE